MFDLDSTRLAVIGLGYVGLPLAVEFGKHMPTVGYDVDSERIKALRGGVDSTLEVASEELSRSEQLSFSDSADALTDCTVYVVAVPTPIDQYKRPDLGPLERATRGLAPHIRAGDVVIYESTVYPGATEEFCVPILESMSGLTFNQDFFVGYSPERINPGDKTHRLPDIRKVTAGSTPEAAAFIDSLYARVIRAGTHLAPSIRVAEAAKVIENTQRDVNIALVNELALIFKELNIDTQAVLEAAGTKWNFLPFRPGLVGGHCIGVDPYYLTHKAQEIGYHPEIILAGRRINDQMGVHVANELTRLMTQRRLHVVGSRILIMGLTFKENCPDIRNSRVVDVYRELTDLNADVEVYDPWVDPDESWREYGIRPIQTPAEGRYDAVLIAVAHDRFRDLGLTGIRALGRDPSIVYDLKYLFQKDEVDGRL
jgi:UDP-N-acetyl-D-galactosamine dehydrogenase